MDKAEYQRMISIFCQACEMIEQDRDEFLKGQCGSDVHLRARIESMLAQDAKPHGPVDAGGAARILASQTVEESKSQQPNQSAPSDISTLSGQYKILRLIGEGGMGRVYEAEQGFPRRKVALKALRPGLATREMMRRFEHEAHILGKLHHPGIAQIFEAGTGAEGRTNEAFIAMELVLGRPLTEYVESNALSLRQKLELVIRICEAVQHAHQRGVIHRDLKPGNILVDESGQPKVLDFGVARAMESNLELTTMHTLSGQLVGTLPYMSPEQVSGDPDDVDTRSDVYSIGVMLFQLLVGRLPRDLTKRTLTEAARIIALEEPPLIGSIDRSLRGEVETIVARALAKDKTRRYQSVGDLGQDLHRYLAGEPIEAKRDSTLYVLKKSMRRHRYAVAAALAFVILVTASTIALAISYRRQGELLDDVRRQSDAEKLARSRAEAEAQKANAVNEFVRDMLASSDPSIAKGKDLLVRDMLDRAALRIDNGSLHDQLEIEAAVRHTMGVAYRSLSQYAPAESHLRKSLEIRKSLFGDSNNDYTETAIALAGVLRDKGETTEALSLCEQAMAYYESSTGRNTERFSHALVLFADLVSVERSDFAGSVAAYREAIGILDTLLGPVNPQSAAALGNLGAQQLAYFRFEDAEKSLRLAHELAVDIYGPDHAVTIMNANNLAAMLTARGRKSEAETVARTALDSAIRLYGPRHVETGRIMFTVAVLARDRGDAIEAVRLCRGALAAVEKELAPDHSLVLWITLALADALATAHENQASADESLKLVMGVQQLIQEHNIENLFLAAETQSVFGNCLASVGRKNEAEVQLKSGYEKLKVCQGAGGNATMTALHRMIRFLDSEGRASDAAKFRSMLPREVAK